MESTCSTCLSGETTGDETIWGPESNRHPNVFTRVSDDRLAVGSIFKVVSSFFSGVLGSIRSIFSSLPDVIASVFHRVFFTANQSYKSDSTKEGNGQ